MIVWKALGRLIIVVLVLWLITFLAEQAQAQTTAEKPFSLPFEVNAKGAVVAELDTGRVLWSRGGDEVLPMASTTKIMTAWLTLEQPYLDLPFTVDKDAIRVEGSSMGLREGDVVTLRTLAAGMLLPSGNDAANAASVRIGGSIPAFVELMNQRAEALSLHNTHFATPSGLDGKNHGSSAADMARLTSAALRNRDFAEICGQSSAKVSFGNPPYERWLRNHNRLLKLYEPAVGVKTGFTKSAGRCLVSAAKNQDGHGLIVVTLGCADDWNTHEKLYDYFLPKLRSLPAPEKTYEIRLEGKSIPLTYELPNLAVLEEEQVEWVSAIQKIQFFPLRRNVPYGFLDCYVNGEKLCSLPLYLRQP